MNVRATDSYDEYARFAQRLADTAARVSLKYFRRPLDVEHKADDSPVTVADRETEAAMRALISDIYPDHGIYGEEHGITSGTGRYTWVVDPIDGTKSFITGMPMYGTLIALLEDGKPVVGVIDMPAMKERWVGVAGQPTRYNGEIVSTRPTARLAESVGYTTSPDSFLECDIPSYEALTEASALRRFGGDCYLHGLLASGFIDYVLEAQLQPYDYMAVIPVIEGAGGRITDWLGKPLGLESTGHLLASASAALHEEALKLIGR